MPIESTVGNRRLRRLVSARTNDLERVQKLEDYVVILGDMQFGQMCEEVNTRAPMLYGLPGGLIALKIKKTGQEPRVPTKSNYMITIITAILCYS